MVRRTCLRASVAVNMQIVYTIGAGRLQIGVGTTCAISGTLLTLVILGVVASGAHW